MIPFFSENTNLILLTEASHKDSDIIEKLHKLWKASCSGSIDPKYYQNRRLFMDPRIMELQWIMQWPVLPVNVGQNQVLVITGLISC